MRVEPCVRCEESFSAVPLYLQWDYMLCLQTGFLFKCADDNIRMWPKYISIRHHHTIQTYNVGKKLILSSNSEESFDAINCSQQHQILLLFNIHVVQCAYMHAFLHRTAAIMNFIGSKRKGKWLSLHFIFIWIKYGCISRITFMTALNMKHENG